MRHADEAYMRLTCGFLSIVDRMAHRVRRTQQERREATQQGLLQAAVRTLEIVGYSTFTTAMVCERAGVSQGALFRYFPTKNALVLAAARHLFEELRGSFGRELTKAAGRMTESRAVLAMWDVFNTPTLRVVYELYCAAATDPELAEGLRPIVDEHTHATRFMAAGLFPHQAKLRDFEARFDLMLFAMQGASLQFAARPELDRGRALVDALMATVRASKKSRGQQ